MRFISFQNLQNLLALLSASLQKFYCLIRRIMKQPFNCYVEKLDNPSKALLETFLYCAIFQPANTKPLPKDIIYTPALYVFIENFGQQKHDRPLFCRQSGRRSNRFGLGAAFKRQNKRVRQYWRYHPWIFPVCKREIPQKRRCHQIDDNNACVFKKAGV